MLKFSLFTLGVCFSALCNFAAAQQLPSYSIFDERLSESEFEVAVLVDEQADLAFEDVKQDIAIQPWQSSRYSIKSSQAGYWFAFTIANPSHMLQTRIVRINEVFMHTADLYYEIDSKLVHIENGLKVPIRDRAYTSRLPVFELKLAPYEERTLYLNIESRLINFIGIYVSDHQKLSLDNARSVAGYFAFFGGSLALLAYNLFLYISLKDSNYLHYVTYGVLYVFFASIYGGFSLYQFPTAELHYLIHCSISIVFVFMSLFIRNLLETAYKFPFIDKILKLIVVVFIIISLLIVINIDFYKLFLHAAIVASLTFWLIGIYTVISGSKIGRFYLAATTLYLIGIMVSAAMALGFLPYSMLNRHAYMMGSISELIIFALALGYRYRLIQDDRIKAERRLTEYEQEQRADLERIVEQRTSQLRRANNQLRMLSFTDGLTGISNRRHFDTSFTREWHRVLRAESKISLIMCDIDYFKAYNDTFGHQAGDECLLLIAETLACSIKRSSDVVSRYGGEEFAIILPDTDAPAALDLCQQIQRRIGELKLPNPPSIGEDYVSLSFGIASIAPSSAEGHEILLSQADQALYSSKENGRNRITLFGNA